MAPEQILETLDGERRKAVVEPPGNKLSRMSVPKWILACNTGEEEIRIE
jgi:hypothetical protein